MLIASTGSKGSKGSGLFCLLAVLALPAGLTSAQTVAMRGEYGASIGRLINLPLNPPKLPCVQTQQARCIFGEVDGGAGGIPDPLAEPLNGVGVDGAGIRIIPGGLDVGAPFTIPPGAFRQAAGPQFTPIVNNLAVIQLDTTFTFSMPAAERAVNPPAATRIFQPDAWSAPGNGQTGRTAASTTPISTATQNVHDITLRYKAGPNAFGGTMASLLDGEGRIYLLGRDTGSGNPTSMPWIGTARLGDGIPGNSVTRAGAGWDYTAMAAQAPGIIRNFGGIAPPCTVATPPSPAGCGLVTNFTGSTIGPLPPATSTRHLFAWTTGTVEVFLTKTFAGFQYDQLLTGMGYDTTSMTSAGATVRNIGLVAGSFTHRNSAGSSASNHQIVGLDMRFTPEPSNAAALVAGLAGLALIANRRRDLTPDLAT